MLHSLTQLLSRRRRQGKFALADSKKTSSRAHFWAILVMGLPEDKVNLLDDDFQETPAPAFVDENDVYEDHSHVCRMLCVSLVYIVILGVLLSAYTFQGSTDEGSLYEKGLLISEFSFCGTDISLLGVCIEELFKLNLSC